MAGNKSQQENEKNWSYWYISCLTQFVLRCWLFSKPFWLFHSLQLVCTTPNLHNTLNSFIHIRQCFALVSDRQVRGKHCQVSFSHFLLVVIYPRHLAQPVKFWLELQFYIKFFTTNNFVSFFSPLRFRQLMATNVSTYSL